MVGSWNGAWGQVTGDQYDNPYLVKEVYPEIEVEANKSYFEGTVYEGFSQDIKAAFDNDNGTYWKAENSGPVSIKVDLGSSMSFNGLRLYRSGAYTERAEKIEIYTSDNDTDLNSSEGWTSSVTIDNINRGSEDSKDQDYEITFDDGEKITSQYIKLVFTPATNQIWAINEIRFNFTELESIEILHKPAKWYSERGDLNNEITGDKFDEQDGHEMFYPDLMIGNSEMKIQSSHTYIDTIYVHKGTTTRLTLPAIQSSAGVTSILAYQRWYSYRTDGTYETNHTDDVFDLLTPVRTEDGKPEAYRFANGYVGNPVAEDANPHYSNSLVAMDFYYPEDNEFGSWFPGVNTEFDNKWYVVACDVSCYTDYTGEGGTNTDEAPTFYPSNNTDGKVYEPTLSHRVLFYIIGVDGDNPDNAVGNFDETYGMLKDNEYQGGTVDNKYLEEFDITFPYTRVSTNTLDMVALTKDARGYAIPGVGKDADTDNLTLTLVDGTGNEASGITFANDTKSSTISGENRVIHFKYPKNSDGLQRTNNPNAKATILVTKKVNETTYNLVRYNLTFAPETQLLTETQLKKIEEGGTDVEDKYWYMPERTPEYMRENYGEPISSMTWDYKGAKEKQEGYYPFPMDWSYSSYAFYDGSTADGGFNGQKQYPQWGYYGIMKGYVEDDKPAIAQDEQYGYHLYVDASDRPGTIARLAFPKILCPGSELFVTARVKSAAVAHNDAGMLFTILRVAEQDGKVVTTPIYRHATGQIMHTTKLGSDVPHTENEWYQVYFSFTNESFGQDDCSYVLQIDNYSASTDGGDMCLDQVEVYVAKPKPRVRQQMLTCGDLTRIRMDLGWEELISRVGLVEQAEELAKKDGSDVTHGIDFCFIDKQEYDRQIEDNVPYTTALEKAAVPIGDPTLGYNELYATLYYDLNYEKNETYTPFVLGETAEDGGSLAINNKIDAENKYCFYKAEAGEDDSPYAEGEKLLSVDFYADMVPNKEYMILIRDHYAEDGDINFNLFNDPDNDDCAITASFFVESQNLIKMNGQVTNATDGYCTGQIFEFSVNMRYLSGDGTKYVDYINDDIMYDWFFGTEEEFNGTDENADSTKPSLRDALHWLRSSEDGCINDTGAKAVEKDGEWKLLLSDGKTGEDKYISVIEKYLNDKPTDDRLQAKLVLLEKTLEIRILEHGLDLWVAPIDTREDPSSNITLCFEPIYLPLKASGKAPQVQPGFEYMDYGKQGDGYNPAMRIGLQQIKDANKDNEGKWITVNLRNARFALNDDEYKGQVPDHIGLRYEAESGEDAPDEGNAPIYLTNSNDPNLNAILHPTDGSEFDRKRYIIGTVKYLTATPNTDGVLSDDDPDENTMVIYFHYGESMDENDTNSPKFEPREGYEYTFTIEIEEHTEDHVSIDGACQGILNLTMKVVPEFLVWQGKEIGKNWNNDANWKRADKERLLKGESDTYLTNEDNATDNGYVPMLFSKAIIPEEHIVELYEAGFNGDETQYKNMKWETTIGNLAYMEHPAIVGEDDNKHPIQYDMMVYTDPVKGSMSTKPYRPNLVDQIHFEPGAEMLHAELLTYNKAWVDYKLASEQWYTLASPLQGVVAGDFYTDKSGTEGSEYFQPIKFSPAENSRIEPSVYQRAWKDAKATMVGVGEGDDGERAIAGNWSAVYNKVDEAYTPGTGFSVKVLDLPDTNTDGNAIFRLPKEGNSYSYYNTETKEYGEAVPFDRDGEGGQLKTNELAGEDSKITVTLTQNGDNDYYLIGNPFMAHLNMEKFFESNPAFAKTYWSVTENSQDVGIGAEITTPIAPLQSFFVKLGEGKTAPTNVTFTADMQVLGGTSTGEGETTGQALMITATNSEGKTSRAAVAYDAMASDDYRAAEDAELFLDSNLGDVPMVYTVAGTMATSINTRTACERVPLGVYGAADEEVTLRFDGTGLFSGVKLYDAKTRAYTPLTDGREVRVRANDYGRYYLTGGLATDNDLIHTGDDIEIYSVRPGEIVVTTVGTPLRAVRVYGVDGDLVTQQTLANQTAYRLNVPRGAIYVVYAEDADGIIRNVKLRVR